MNNISNQLEQLIQKQKKTYKEMTDLINQSCKIMIYHQWGKF